MRANLLDYDLEGLARFCEGLGEKRFRAVQLFRWIHQRGASDFDAMTDLAKSLREKLKTSAQVQALAVVSQHVSADGTIKWLFDVGAGDAIEAVYIPEADRGTLCVSSQAGCAVACRFCSTGHQGFSRNLTAGEIISQLWFAEHFLRKHLGRDEAQQRERVRLLADAARCGGDAVEMRWRCSVTRAGGPAQRLRGGARAGALRACRGRRRRRAA